MAKARAAAICYRRQAECYQFLLVRTSGGSRWTFPKGRVEKQETPAEAAAREAFEEAGVSGRVDDQLLTNYWFPGGRDGKHQVSAFLLEVTSQGEPDESYRSPTWCSLQEAKEELALGREQEFAIEHTRVLDAAIEKLSEDGPSELGRESLK